MKPCLKIYILVFHGFRNVFGALFICLVIVIYSSCQKPQSYGPIPEISMKNYLVIDSILDTTVFKKNRARALIIKFEFVDGDGNISDPYERQLVIVPPDTIQKDTSTHSKVFLKLYEKKNGLYFPVSDSALLTPPSFIIPYGDAMSREGQNKTQKGEMKIDYLFYYVNSKLPFDTIQIELYITDLAFQKSNIITVTDISLTKK